MTAPYWSSLTADQRAALLSSPGRSVALGAELLDQSLNVVGSLLLQEGSGQVQWNGASSDQRDGVQSIASFTLALDVELAWGRDLVRLFKVTTDRVSGVSARGDLGVYCLPFPDRVAGVTIRGDDGVARQAYSLSCQDRSAQLDHIPGYTYTAADGQTVVAAIAGVLDAAGVSGYWIDGSNQAAMPTGGRTWEFGGGSDQSLWRAMVNDLADMIGYEPIWCTGSGQLMVSPAADLVKSPAQALDAASAGVSPLGSSRTRKHDLASTPNQWSVLWVDADGAAVEDTVSPYVFTNQSDGPASVDALGGAPLGVRPAQQQQVQAATRTDFLARAKAIVATSSSAVTEYDVTTVGWPELPHAPLFDYVDPDTTGQDGAVRTVATSAEIALSDADTVWTLREVSVT